MPTPILSKAEMYRRLNAGELGHTLSAAETPEAAERILSFGGTFALRLKQAGGKCEFGLTVEQVRQRIRELPAGMWNLSAMIRDEHRMCYAHLWDTVGGWNLHYSNEPKPCRLKQEQDGCEQKTLIGLAAKLYVQSILDDIGWQTLLNLVEQYPDHCIEFTAMSGATYALGPTNLIVWEVRFCGDYSPYEKDSEWGK